MRLTPLMIMMALLICPEASAQKALKGGLPKGSLKVDRNQPERPEARKMRRNCFSDYMNPPGGNGQFTSDGTFLYLLANTGEEKVKKRSVSKYSIYSVNLDNKINLPIIGLSQKRDATLMVAGAPVDSFSAISFYGRNTICHTGRIAMITIPMKDAKGKPTKTGSKTPRQLVRSANGYVLSDVKKNTVLELDTHSFQARRAVSFSKNQRPLWYDPTSRELLAYEKGDKPELRKIKYGKVLSKAAISAKQKVVQQQERLGLVSFNMRKNEMEIAESKQWSGVKKNGKFKITVPAAYAVRSAGMEVDFDKKIAVVFGANPVIRQKWQRIFIYQYDQGADPIETLAVSGNEYFHFTGIDPQARMVVAEVKDITTRLSKRLEVFEFGSKSTKTIKLARPKKS